MIATLTFAVSFMGQFVTFYLIDRIGVTGTGIQLMLLVAPNMLTNALASILVLGVAVAASFVVARVAAPRPA